MSILGKIALNEWVELNLQHFKTNRLGNETQDLYLEMAKAYYGIPNLTVESWQRTAIKEAVHLVAFSNNPAITNTPVGVKKMRLSYHEVINLLHKHLASENEDLEFSFFNVDGSPIQTFTCIYKSTKP